MPDYTMMASTLSRDEVRAETVAANTRGDSQIFSGPQGGR